MMTTNSFVQNAPPPSDPVAPTFIKVPSIDECAATVVLLHGLGDTPAGFLRLARNLRSKTDQLNHVQFIVPAAPVWFLSATGQAIPACFDIYSFDLPLAIPGPGEEDEDGIRQSIASLDALLAELIATGADPNRRIFARYEESQTFVPPIMTDH
ncbi:hypothetical protein B0H19DRAFT_700611 [Mycena capillaripes]|nr:hypothetical protein B0H19DRAFT_700611 [Mycena capillaripes]